MSEHTVRRGLKIFGVIHFQCQGYNDWSYIYCRIDQYYTGCVELELNFNETSNLTPHESTLVRVNIIFDHYSFKTVVSISAAFSFQK